MIVKVKKLTKDAKLPAQALPGDVGFDLFANEEVVLKPGERKLVGTGIKIALPEGCEAQVRPKSGLAINHGITVLNTPGTIDAGYRGEIKVILINLSNEEFKVEKGQKIAQMVFNKVEIPKLEEVEELDKTARNERGFGSTGLH
ncbi:MAG: dUTP diphosphatase [Candidatus Iainarchaeum archaeon]|uniref:dUTP diphosphatase n=1 Tax=Candidatus Iainarchaeum sp. TaxID=3101447 RepID=A0A497JHX1_9ARCH|nr:MAG: dUTP diphosphatase [Candidatus Diapherotrites archaeon]